MVAVLLLGGCTFEGTNVSPREVLCRAECTPDFQMVECKGQSEGTEKKSVDIKGQ